MKLQHIFPIFFYGAIVFEACSMEEQRPSKQSVYNAPIEKQPSQIGEALPALDLKSLLGFDQTTGARNVVEDYLSKLYKIANILLLKQRLANMFEILIQADTQALASAFKPFRIVCYDYMSPTKHLGFLKTAVKKSDDGRREVLEGGSLVLGEDGRKYIKQSAYIFSTPEGKSAYLQAKHLLRKDVIFTKGKSKEEIEEERKKLRVSKDIESDLSSVDERYKKINEYVTAWCNSDNPEIVFVGNYAKNYVEQIKRSISFSNLIRQFVPLYYQIGINREPEVKKLYDNINDKRPFVAHFINKRKTKQLVDNFLGESAQFVHDHVAHLYAFIQTLEQMCQQIGILRNQSEFLAYRENEVFHKLIAPMYELFKEKQSSDVYLYEQIKKELTSFFTDKKCSCRRELVLKYGKFIFDFSGHNVPFPDQLVTSEQQNNKQAQETSNEWLSHVNPRRQVKPKQKKKDNKKKGHSTRSAIKKHEVLVPDRPAKTIIHDEPVKKKAEICYDDRVMRRFYSDEPDLYHAYPWLVDYYVFKFGIPLPRPNKTRKGQIDTVYYLGGEIHSKGAVQTVLFACCKDPNDVCYHRGFGRKQDSLFQEFERSSFEFNFPVVSEQEPMRVKTLLFNIHDEEHKCVFKKNKFCIYVKDPRNNVDIVLFKPLKKLITAGI